MENYMDISSDDYDTDIESDKEMDDKQYQIYSTKKVIQPVPSYRYVHRLNGKLSLSKMKTDKSYRVYFLTRNPANDPEGPDPSEIVTDDSDIDDDDDDDDDIVVENETPVINSSIKQEHNLDDIREKTLEYDRQQIKGIQLANAGGNNPKIINNYSVTSSTCILM